MRWDREAEESLTRVPALLRRFVRGKVEAFARERGLERVTREVAAEARRAHAPGQGDSMEPEPALIERLERELLVSKESHHVTRTYEVHGCAGAVGCPRSLIPVDTVAKALAAAVEAAGFPAWLEAGREGRPLLSHHRFRVAVAGCPNACSQPQIQDLGVIGQVDLTVHPDRCQNCRQCLSACREEAIRLEPELGVLRARCLGCGDCARVCPAGALELAHSSCRVLAGGRLGRHPRLATEIRTATAPSELPGLLAGLLALLMQKGEPGARLAEVLGSTLGAPPSADGAG